MNLQEIQKKAKELCTKCKVCPVCNGIACKGQVPGMGGKGSGSSFIRNVEKLKDIKIVMDVLNDNQTPNTKTQLFNKEVSMPVYMAPIAGVLNNYGADITDEEYTKYVLEGCKMAGTIGFTGDGKFLDMFSKPLDMVDSLGGDGIPTMKPWVKEGVDIRMQYLKTKNALALATDVDSAGLPLLRNSEIPVETKNVESLKYIKSLINLPLIVKGVMDKKAAQKAFLAGADAIVVSNHGGRVQDETLSTIEVLKEIADEYKGKMTILVDGGFRTGVDVFKALALGADGVLIGRSLGIAAIGGKSEGVKTALNQIQDELKGTMVMTGCANISDITLEKVVLL